MVKKRNTTQEIPKILSSSSFLWWHCHHYMCLLRGRVWSRIVSQARLEIPVQETMRCLLELSLNFIIIRSWLKICDQFWPAIDDLYSLASDKMLYRKRLRFILACHGKLLVFVGVKLGLSLLTFCSVSVINSP